MCFFIDKTMLRNILHQNSRGMFSDKSVLSFMERMSATNRRSGWLQCRKDYAVYLGDDSRVYILHPDSFPFAKRDQYRCNNDQVQIDGETCKIGPWRITARRDKNLSTSDLGRKPFKSMEEFMQGEFYYCIETPHDCKSLAIVGGGAPFSKPSRPAAWKSLDPKIEISLPLVARFGKEEVETEAAIIRLDYKLVNT